MLRFVAAAWVLVFHLGVFARQDAIGAMARGSRGYLGVDFFFVLSGFILTHVYLTPWEAGRFSMRTFLVHRFARIYPMHLLVLAANVLLFGALALGGLAPRPVEWSQLPAVASMVHAWGMLATLDWNDPSWSVSAEWFAYLTFPGFLLLTGVHRRHPVAGLLGSCVAFALCYAASPPVFGERLTELTYDFGIVRIAPEFALGSALYVAALRWAPAPRASTALAAACLVALPLLVALGGPDWLAVLLLAALIYAVADGDRCGGGGPLHAPVAVWLGEISYGVYIIHFVLFYAWFGALKVVADLAPGEVPWPLTLPPLLATVALAAVTYRLVEVPARRWIRELGRRA